MPNLCVFCGSKTGDASRHAQAARDLAAAMLRRGWGLVYGGGNIGLMGVLADALLAGGGRVIGVIPRFMVLKELAHQGLNELILVDSMHERKALMAERADVFAALPGGFGTADELFEILTWRQLHLHDRPIGLLNVGGFFDPLLNWLDVMVAEGFLKRGNRELLIVRSDVEELLDEFAACGLAP
jgi:uncharacterized protein (TIGR00730 family)